MSSLRRLEQRVARAHCQAVFLANGRAGNDPRPHEKRVCHPLDESELLEVFLAKVSVVRLCDVEKLHYDRQNPIEMPGAVCAAKDLAQLVLRHSITVVVPIKLFVLRIEKKIRFRG